jgi:hypothetical protein
VGHCTQALWPRKGFFHHRDLLLRQPVEPIDDLVDQAVGGGDALDELPVRRMVAAVDAHHVAQAGDRPRQLLDKDLETIFIPAQALVQVMPLVAAFLNKGPASSVFPKGTVLLPVLVQVLEGVGDALQIEPEGLDPLLLLLVHRDHPFGQVGQQVVDHVGLFGLSGETFVQPGTQQGVEEG